MKVQGLNNQGFQQTAKTPAGKSSQGKGTSFESLLGDAQDRDNNSHIQQDNSGKDRDQSRRDDGPQAKAPAPQVKSVAAKQSPAAPQAKPHSVVSASRVSTTPSAPKVTENSARAENSVRTESADTSPQSIDQNLEVEGNDVTAQGLPNGQGAPSIGTPGLADRSSVAPQLNNGVNLNPMAAPSQPAMTDDAANSLTRRVVWNDFLRKMNDLGVSAEDVLKAFGSLSEKDLAQPPEQSMDKIVAALGLNAPQAAQAKQYFSELLTKTKSKSLGEEITASHKQLSLTLASQRDLQRKAQLQSIDNLNNNFFMNKAMKAPQAQGEQNPIGPDGKPVALPAAMPEAAQDGMPQLDGQSLMPQNSFARQNVPNGLPQPRTAAASQGNSELNGLVNQMQAQGQQQPLTSVEDKKSVDQLIKNFTSRATKAAPEMAMAQAAVAPAAGMQAMQMAAPAHADSRALNELNAILAGGRRRDEDNAGDGDDQSSGGAQFIDQTQIGDQRMLPGEALKTEFQGALEAKGPQQPQQMSAPELVQQAHLMVRDGGGDMKVTLRPDGLGEVALRVSVTDGKVNVQMITESDEAKKLIERQIGDLKNGLAQNHLQVDSIKIDTATNLGKQLEQQYHDAQRQQTQAQWEQFRQDGGNSWKRSFFDTGVVNPYHSQGETPRDTRAPAAQARSRSTDGSRRLDLVA